MTDTSSILSSSISPENRICSFRRLTQASTRGRWSAEATVAAQEVLQDRLAGRAQEPQNPEEDEPPEIHYEPDEVALGVLAGLLTGYLVIPYYRIVEDPDLPVPFGRQMAWLSLDTTDTAAVARALGLREAREATWGVGIEAAHRGSVYVSPPVADWTLAVCTALFQTPEGLATTLKPVLENLSRQFKDVQYFCNHRDIGMYAWARARQGRLVRGYGWLGARGVTLWDEGAPTKEERGLGFRCGTGQPPTVELADTNELAPLTEDCVLELASLWSIDPTTLDGEYKVPVLGSLGSITASDGRTLIRFSQSREIISTATGSGVFLDAFSPGSQQRWGGHGRGDPACYRRRARLLAK
jgi:hypothetical protein